jgi:hypothetical protein
MWPGRQRSARFASGWHGQLNLENRSGLRGTAGNDRPVLQPNQVLHDRQPQSGTTRFRAARWIGSKEAVEHALQVVGGDVGTAVADAQEGLLGLVYRTFDGYSYLAAAWCIFPCVIQKIIDDALEFSGVPQHPNTGIKVRT